MPSIDTQNPPTSVILGATSALGQAVARQLVGEGHRLILCARDQAKLDAVAKDLSVRSGAAAAADDTHSSVELVSCHVIDFDQIAEHEAFVDVIGEADNFWFFYGTLPDQNECESSWELSAAAFHTNFTSAASLLTHLANRLEARGRGHGTSTEMTPEEALAVALNATSDTPERTDAADPQGLQVGMDVSVAPLTNSGESGVNGKIRSVSRDRIALARNDERCGDVVVHFPRVGYRVSPS